MPDQKSLRLIARKKYDPDNGKFKYAFFNGAETQDGVPVSEYDRIVLRNGANDREFAGVRDELSQKLAQDYGYTALHAGSGVPQRGILRVFLGARELQR